MWIGTSSSPSFSPGEGVLKRGDLLVVGLEPPPARTARRRGVKEVRGLEVASAQVAMAGAGQVDRAEQPQVRA
jgi:hypothetical protein